MEISDEAMREGLEKARTPKLTAEEDFHTSCSCPICRGIRRKAFEEAAGRLDLEAVRFERKQFVPAESPASEYRRAATLVRALAKGQTK